ncbi:hypothetical protein BOSE127_120172 [Bosea sp. 127]|nr:hypothetical protein BOSE127_120172 [Bosea sp. 127]
MRCRRDKTAREPCGEKGERHNLPTGSPFARGVEAPHSQRQGPIDNLGMYLHPAPPLPRTSPLIALPCPVLCSNSYSIGLADTTASRSGNR